MRWTEKQYRAYAQKGVQIECLDCGAKAIATGPMQKYCVDCSNTRSKIRAASWARENPPSKEYTSRKGRERNDTAVEVGKLINQQNRQKWYLREVPWLRWSVKYHVPFTYATSKNAIYRPDARGHLFLRDEARRARNDIIAATQRVMKDTPVAKNKIWIDLLVEKPDHRGDAINVLDTVCDALKVGLGVDDRWFCIRQLDWSICKTDDPLLCIGIGQGDVEDSQVCSSCGRILPYRMFSSNKSNPSGLNRNCKECRSSKKAIELGLKETPVNISTRRRIEREAANSQD